MVVTNNRPIFLVELAQVKKARNRNALHLQWNQVTLFLFFLQVPFPEGVKTSNESAAKYIS